MQINRIVGIDCLRSYVKSARRVYAQTDVGYCYLRLHKKDFEQLLSRWSSGWFQISWRDDELYIG